MKLQMNVRIYLKLIPAVRIEAALDTWTTQIDLKALQSVFHRETTVVMATGNDAD